MSRTERPVIELKNLTKTFTLKRGLFQGKPLKLNAVDDVDLTINRGEILGLVGESGSGKTTLARMILKLATPTKSTVLIDGVDIFKAGRKTMKEIRQKIAVVFQDPAASLNPRVTISASIIRPMVINGIPKKEAVKRAEEVIRRVKLDESYLNSYPHQLSGGQLQRVSIARALAIEPEVIVLDEPTSALDISVQAQILNLLLELQEEFQLTYLLITHDLNVVRYMSDRIAVMYLGKIMEYGDVDSVFNNPLHPYTKGLLASAPVLDPEKRRADRFKLEHEPDSLINLPRGCRLSNRCRFKQEKCVRDIPALRPVEDNHMVACVRAEEIIMETAGSAEHN